MFYIIQVLENVFKRLSISELNRSRAVCKIWGSEALLRFKKEPYSNFYPITFTKKEDMDKYIKTFQSSQKPTFQNPCFEFADNLSATHVYSFLQFLKTSDSVVQFVKLRVFPTDINNGSFQNALSALSQNLVELNLLIPASSIYERPPDNLEFNVLEKLERLTITIDCLGVNDDVGLVDYELSNVDMHLAILGKSPKLTYFHLDLNVSESTESYILGTLSTFPCFGSDYLHNITHVSFCELNFMCLDYLADLVTSGLKPKSFRIKEIYCFEDEDSDDEDLVEYNAHVIQDGVGKILHLFNLLQGFLVELRIGSYCGIGNLQIPFNGCFESLSILEVPPELSFVNVNADNFQIQFPRLTKFWVN